MHVLFPGGEFQLKVAELNPADPVPEEEEEEDGGRRRRVPAERAHLVLSDPSVPESE